MAVKKYKLSLLGVSDAIKKALRAKVLKVVTGVGQQAVTYEGYEIDGVVYTGDAALEKICGEYSWWTDKEDE